MSASRRVRALPEIVVTAVGLCTWSIVLGRALGVEADEAWVLLRAREIAVTGVHPLDGMNHYTGALHLYLLLPFFRAFGYRAVVARAVSIVLGLGAIVVTMRIARILAGRGAAQAAAWCTGALLVTSPALLAWSRWAIEVNLLLPLLCTTGVLLLLRSQRLLAGALFGVAIYLHAVALALPVGVLAALWLHRAWRASALRASAAFVVGIVLGAAPRIYCFLFHARTTESVGPPMTLRAAIADLPHAPRILAGLLDGDLIYERMVGYAALPVVPYVVVACAIIAVVAFWVLRGDARPRWVPALPGALGALSIATLLLLPRYALHHFAFLLLGALLLLGLTMAALVERGHRLLVVGVLAVVVAGNAVYAGADYFAAYLRTGGVHRDLALGDRLDDSSRWFFSTAPLYDELTHHGVDVVVTRDAATQWPLLADDIDRGALLTRTGSMRIIDGETFDRERSLPFRRVAFIGNMTSGWVCDPNKTFERAGCRLHADCSFDPHWKTFLATPADCGPP